MIDEVDEVGICPGKSVLSTILKYSPTPRTTSRGRARCSSSDHNAETHGSTSSASFSSFLRIGKFNRHCQQASNARSIPRVPETSSWSQPRVRRHDHAKTSLRTNQHRPRTSTIGTHEVLLCLSMNSFGLSETQSSRLWCGLTVRLMFPQYLEKCQWRCGHSSITSTVEPSEG
jgi:hypothetical protein